MYHEEKGFDRKIRERRLCFREPAAGVSRQQGVQDNWSLSRRRNIRALSRVSRLCRTLPVTGVHIVRCDERAHQLRQKEWYHGEFLRLFCIANRIAVRKGLFYCLDWKQMYESLFRIFFRTSFRQILLLTVSKILAIRKYACGFFPCHRQNHAQKSAYKKIQNKL